MLCVPQIRLRGEEPEKVQEASVAVTKYLAELRGSFTVKANQTQQQDLEDKMYLQVGRSLLIL